MTPDFEPQFLRLEPGPLGSRFAVHHFPGSVEPRGLVVHVHAFADEMNKSRRMVAMQSRELAAQGFAVLRMDLLGCGDSPGDFGDATWSRWIEDVVAACHWLRARYPASLATPAPPLWLWGLRGGCLVACAAAEQVGEPCHFVFWQPYTSGKLLLHHFLRLKVASELLGGQAKAAMEELRSDLAAGRSVEVAGYQLSPALCQGLEQAQLRPPAICGAAHWLELSGAQAPMMSPASSAGVATWREAGWTVGTMLLRGPAFWQTTEIEDVPALLPATWAAMVENQAAPTP